MERIPALIAGAIAALLLVCAPAGAHPAQSGDVLPDLDQMAPVDLSVRSTVVDGRRVFRLGFASAAANVGDGPLTLHGHRPGLKTRTMKVDQLVERRTDVPRLIRDVGRMSYVVHPDHRHWHLLGFERYELRRAGATLGSKLEDRKTGFCLGDRFAIPDAERLRGFNPTPLQGDTCGLGQPGLVGLFAGISVGYADRYEAQIEGQYIDITRAAAGRHVLVHRVNTDRRLLESNYTNNASSVALSLTWPRGRKHRPRIRVLRTCPASASCSP